jgi:hypothetical protein
VAWRIRRAVTSVRVVSDRASAATGAALLATDMLEGDRLGTSMRWNAGQDHDRFVRTWQGWRHGQEVGGVARPAEGGRGHVLAATIDARP